MSPIILIIAGACLLLGFHLGRRAEKGPAGASCPRCRQKRLYYCRGCGHHFDDDDQAIDPREYERMTEPRFLQDEVDT